MHFGKLAFGFVLAALLSATGCTSCGSKSCGGRPPGAVSAFPPPPCNSCQTGCPDGNCGAAAPIVAAPVQAYSVPPAAVIPNGYAR